MAAIATDNGTILVFANKFDGAILEVIQESDKAVRVRNKENGRECWLPKSGIMLRKPGIPTYENEYNVAAWFRCRMNAAQERALNLLE